VKQLKGLGTADEIVRWRREKDTSRSGAEGKVECLEVPEILESLRRSVVCLAGGARSHDQCSCGEWAGEEAGDWSSCTERISAPLALMPVALPFANAV
jgi:hypothetical protein